MIARRGCTVLAAIATASLSASPVLGQSTATFTYDALGRVVGVSYPSGAYVAYTYDAAGNRTRQIMSLTANHPPIANPDTATVAAGSSKDILVLQNDTDGDQDPLTITAVTGATLGQATATSNNTAIHYVANAGVTGTDIIRYTVVDGHNGTDVGTLTIAVSAAAPVANPVSGQHVAYNTAAPIALNISGGTPSSVAVSLQAGHGSAVASGTTITYTPGSNYSGSDSFQYTASNSAGTSAPALASFTVDGPTCTSPSASGVSRTVAYGSSGNAITPSVTGSYTSVSVASAAQHGSASASGTTLYYTPTSNYSGPDSFTYIATGCASSGPATVSITVSAPPAPTAGNVSMTVAYNSTGTVALAPGGIWTSSTIIYPGTNGVGSVSGSTGTYTPNTNWYGSDTFTYEMIGPGGNSSPGFVNVTVNPPAGLSATVSSTSYDRELWGAGANWQPSAPSVVTAIPNGGVGPYTYSWEYVSGDTGMIASDQASASTGWTHTTGMTLEQTYTSTWRCKVTDSTGQVAYTTGVTITTTRRTLSGG